MSLLSNSVNSSKMLSILIVFIASILITALLPNTPSLADDYGTELQNAINDMPSSGNTTVVQTYNEMATLVQSDLLHIYWDQNPNNYGSFADPTYDGNGDLINLD